MQSSYDLYVSASRVVTERNGSMDKACFVAAYSEPHGVSGSLGGVINKGRCYGIMLLGARY